MGTMIAYDRMRHAATLLDACIATEAKITRRDVKGGTIHEYLPRLKWLYAGNVRGQGPTWHLMLTGFAPATLAEYGYERGGVDIGWYAGTKTHLPQITPDLMPGYLYSLPCDVEYVSA